MPNFTIGLDLGQTRDPSVLVIVERLAFREDPDYEYVDHWHVRHVQRFEIGTSYPAIVAEVGRILAAPELDDCTKFRFDATGVGRAVADMFRDAYRDGRLGRRWPEPITLTAGRGSSGLNIAKQDLVGGLQRLLQERRLAVPPDLPGADKLRQELSDFTAKISAAGRDTFEAATEAAHDDHVIALALATHRPHFEGEARYVSPDGLVCDAAQGGW